MRGLAIRSRSQQTECPFCREALQGSVSRCKGCQTAYHAECRAELGGCALLGCGEEAPPILVRVGRRSALLGEAAGVLAGLLVLGAFAALLAAPILWGALPDAVHRAANAALRWVGFLLRLVLPLAGVGFMLWIYESCSKEDR